ncbi:hypothetical protein B7993_16030 [Fibrobacter sp. UWH3]|nr:hypothetical protein B7993_16030 [Fibrobacter sp. UWH3]SHK42508.1 hypothetical protein SAMN05720765_102205 [Fibrobacter sp. UWH6]
MFNNVERQFVWKKDVGRDIYLNGALDSLNTINANDPRPERAVVHGLYSQKTSLKKPARQTETYCKKAVCLRERSPCPRVVKWSRFRLENKSKNSIFNKNKLKKRFFAQKSLQKPWFSTVLSKSGWMGQARRCGAAFEPRRGGSGRPGRVGFETLFPKGMIIGTGTGLQRGGDLPHHLRTGL